MPQFRTFGWIARQNPDIKIMENSIEDNKRFNFPQINKLDLQTPLEDRTKWLKKGELWPTVIICEKGWDETGNIRFEHAYIRIFRNNDGAILDILVGLSLDFATLIAADFNVPLFSVTSSRKGIKGTAQRIHMDII